MDWNRIALMASQCLVVVVLAGLVAGGHDSTITDALLATCGSVAGIGLYQAVKRS